MSVNETPDVHLDRRLTDWLEADAAPRAPQSLETAFVEGVASTRQRPAWATAEWWIPMETRAQLGVVPRGVIALLAIALLAVGAIGGYAVGSGLVDVSDGGDPLAGLTYHTREGIIYQRPADEAGEPVRLTGDDERANNLRWSPDGTRFAYLSWPDGSGPPAIAIRDADGSNPVVVSERGPAPDPYFVWSPDGSRLLFWATGLDVADEEVGCQTSWAFCGQRIWSVASDGSESARVVGDPALDAIEPLWSPDGESIIFNGSAAGSGLGYGIYRMDADGSNVERVGDLQADFGGFSLEAISPDGTTLAVSIGTDDEDIYLVDLATGEDALIAGEDEDEGGVSWSPDGSTIAYTRIGGFGDVEEVMLYDVASGETISVAESLWVAAWSPDSRSIVGWLDGMLTVVDVTDPTAPVATEVEGVTDGDGPSWQPVP
jgi:Tol biopolymer transport system component